jgi:hypothetical protein
MISTIAIVIAGLSLGIVVTTMYRNTPNPVSIIDIEKGATPNKGNIECQIEPVQSQEIAIVDSELNLIV